MYTVNKTETPLVDGKIPIDDRYRNAFRTFVRLHGEGTCKMRAVWEDEAGDTYAEKKDLSAEDYQEINARIDAIEISETAGEGTVIIESIYL